MEKNKKIDVSLLITFHNEGILAYSTLNSIERCRKYAEDVGITTEYIWVLDSTSEETRKVLMSHPAANGNVKIIEVSHKDLGASRNSGVQGASGAAIAILDGDDYFSTNWIERAWFYLQEYGDKVILHPEVVINFGAHSAYCWQVDQGIPDFDKNSLLAHNLWTSWTFAKRSVYRNCPYSTTRPQETGFGYEDWHWNCESVASGYQHRLALKTVGFYRRKKSSLVTTTTALGAIIPPTKLFSRDELNKENS